MQRFPQALYRAPGVEIIDGVGLATRLVRNEEEHESAISEGWSETAADAVALHALPAPKAVPTKRARDDLEAKAKHLGIEVSPRVSDKALAKAIAEKQAA